MIYLSKYAAFRIDENIQLADKLYFKTNKLTEEDKNLILHITNGDNYTKLLCDLLFIANQRLYPVNYDFKADLTEAYSQLKTYNKNYFPIKDFDKSDIKHIFLEEFNNRKKVLDHMKKLPSVAIRNMKEDIRKERSSQEFSFPKHHSYCSFQLFLQRYENIFTKTKNKSIFI